MTGPLDIPRRALDRATAQAMLKYKLRGATFPGGAVRHKVRGAGWVLCAASEAAALNAKVGSPTFEKSDALPVCSDFPGLKA